MRPVLSGFTQIRLAPPQVLLRLQAAFLERPDLGFEALDPFLSLPEIGFGAAKSQARIHAQRRFSEGNWLGLSGTAFQRIFEFRVAKGTVFGLAVDGGRRLGDRTALSGSLAVYRHNAGVETPEVDWNQVRASIQFDWTVGAEPGAGGRR